MSSSHHDDVDLPEGLLPGDHANVPHHWYSKYTTHLSEFAESFSTKYHWGNDVVNRSTGEKVWEPMPLVVDTRSKADRVVHPNWNAFVVCGTSPR